MREEKTCKHVINIKCSLILSVEYNSLDLCATT